MDQVDLNQIIEVLQQLLEEVIRTRKNIEQILQTNNIQARQRKFYAEPS
jgi:flagellar biosynthesis component FlhA